MHQVVEGMRLDRGYISAFFVTDPKTMKAELDSPYILIVEKKISGCARLLRCFILKPPHTGCNSVPVANHSFMSCVRSYSLAAFAIL